MAWVFGGTEEEECDGGRACHEWDGEGDDERFFVERFTEDGASGEDHAEGDEEEDDAAGDAEGMGAKAEDIEEVVALEEEEEEDGEGDEELADQDAGAAVFGDFGEYRVEDGCVAEGVEDEEESKGEGEQVHS